MAQDARLGAFLVGRQEVGLADAGPHRLALGGQGQQLPGCSPRENAQSQPGNEHQTKKYRKEESKTRNEPCAEKRP